MNYEQEFRFQRAQFYRDAIAAKVEELNALLAQGSKIGMRYTTAIDFDDNISIDCLFALVTVKPKEDSR
jgi:hypothetical protein